MFLEFSPALAAALESARGYAAQVGAGQVEPVHLFRAFLNERDGRAAQALAHAGLDIEAAAGRFEPARDTLPSSPPTLPIPRGPGCDAILEMASALARDLSDDRVVTSDQAVLALLQHDDELCESLTAFGLSLERLQERVAAPPPPLRLEEPLVLADPVEEVETSRILDAAANRAREALRVVEDYCRFVLDDAFLSRELKCLRHELREELSHLPAMSFLKGRDTLQDVGAGVTAPGEHERHSLGEVVQAGLKRLEEALRSLEEFGKLHGPDVGLAFEKLRYRAYTLEKAILLGADARRGLADARLYVLVTGTQCAAAIDWTIREAAAGGAQIFQLREKALADRELIDRARKMRCWTRECGALLIVNERPDIARLVEADGVHLGQDDMSVKDARRIMGPKGLIGVSAHDLAQVRQAALDGASYIGVGPTFPSGTKAFPALAGLELVRQAAAETTLPAFVIGGIQAKNLAAALDAGARRIAVGEAICKSEDPQAAARQLRSMLAARL
jgi:thiamine-phosphate pyrophosphorylase